MLSLRRDVALASLSLAHASSMYRWMCDPEVRINLGLRNDPSLQNTVNWINKALNNPQAHAFAIMLRDQYVGNVVLDHLDTYLSSARFHIYLGEPSARGKGVGLTSTYLICSKGFNDYGLNKIWLTVHCQNHAAITTYTKVGFVIEGTLRDEFWLNDRRTAAFYMGLLHDEFTRLETNFNIG